MAVPSPYAAAEPTVPAASRLMVAVTGGIGSGKSTVSAALAALGAVVIDSDVLARAVVAPGTPGLAAVASRFGPRVIAPDGSLDRPALGRIVFDDPAARSELEHIVHPLVRSAARSIAEDAPSGSVVVNDIPLLVTLEQTAQFHLVIGVRVEEEERVRRLVLRGLGEADARSRIAAQITDAERRPLTDVVLSNEGEPSDLTAAVREVWADRLVAMASNLASATPAGPVEGECGTEVLARGLARARRALGEVDPAASATVDGDVVRLSGVEADAQVLAAALGGAGYFPVGGTGGYRYLDPVQPVVVSALG